MAKVGLVFGGRSTEHEVSITSARNIAVALAAAGHAVVPLGVAEDGAWVEPARARAALEGGLAALPAPAADTAGKVAGTAAFSVARSLERLLESEVEVLFPILHGTYGEDGCFQGLAESLDLPYVGPGVAASAVAMNKLLCKGTLERAGIAVGSYRGVRRHRFETARDEVLAELATLGFPLFVKPAVGGSSVGIRKVKGAGELAEAIAFAFRFDHEVIVERGVTGRELECAVLGHGEIEASVIGEIVPGKEFYDYADKYLEDGAQLIAPAVLPLGVEGRIQGTAIEAFRAIGGSGLARVDFFLEEDGALMINEINTLPGFTAISMYPRLWELSGVPGPALADRLVACAFERHAERRRLDRGIREWLAELAAR